MLSNFKNNQGCVISRLEGGLGNQLFMYAAARRLAHANDVPVKFESKSGFDSDVRYHRTLLLQCFGVKLVEASSHEAFVYEERRKYFVRKLNRVLPFSWRTFLEERSTFEPRLLSYRVRCPVFLQGYWQDERYFEDISCLLRKEIKIPSSDGRMELAGLDWSNTVGVHFRRVDYEHLLPLEYYKMAIDQIERSASGLTYLALGDDPDFIRQHAKTIFPKTANIIIPREPADQLEDFHRLSQCGRLIIANSSFSWWAAWLNEAPKDYIWAPKQWGYMANASRHWNLV